MNVIRGMTDWLFSAPEGARSAWSVILWWELRRIPYNLIVGAVGVCSLTLFFVLAGSCAELEQLEPGEDLVEPMGILFAPFVMNAGYTAGWVYELYLRTNDPEEAEGIAPELWRKGVWFSLIVVIIPSAVWGGICLMRLLGFSRS